MKDKILKDLKPTVVFKYFEEICKVPRGSGNEGAMAHYLKDFADKNSLVYIRDNANNVIIKKEASKGYESAEEVVLQGHMDMVLEKEKDSHFDFLKDEIIPVIKGDYVYAKGTTLGADDGIAVAMCLAILESSTISHPKLEVLFTTGEEIGLRGAEALEPENISGRTLINIDSEKEGDLLVSCAGGIRNYIYLPVKHIPLTGDFKVYKVEVDGLLGGHSGTEIHKGRANANKLLGRLLKALENETSVLISSINGGSKENAIPRYAEAIIAVKNYDKINDIINKYNNIFKCEFKTSDPNVDISLMELDHKDVFVINEEESFKAINILYMIPNGIESMSMDIEGLVESSSNLGIVEINEDKIIFRSSIRSSVYSLKEEILERTRTVAKAYGAELLSYASYPEWQYDKNSKIREIFIRVYKKMFNKEPNIVALHAGVECAVFKHKFKDIDMISFGPDLFDVHTPKEHLSISSVERTYNYLLEVLKNLK